MTEFTRKTTAFCGEGYLMVGDLRRIVAETQEFDDSARVMAGMEDGRIDQIDTLIVEGTLQTGESDV